MRLETSCLGNSVAFSVQPNSRSLFDKCSVHRVTHHCHFLTNRELLYTAWYFYNVRLMTRPGHSGRLGVPTPRLSHSRLFLRVVPRWWNDLQSTTRTGASLSIFKKLLKTQLFREHLLSCTSLYACTLFLTRGFPSM